MSRFPVRLLLSIVLTLPGICEPARTCFNDIATSLQSYAILEPGTQE